MLGPSKGYDEKKKRDIIVVCKVLYEFAGKDSLYLEETAMLRGKESSFSYFQKMKLWIIETQNEIKLSGTWQIPAIAKGWEPFALEEKVKRE